MYGHFTSLNSKQAQVNLLIYLFIFLLRREVVLSFLLVESNRDKHVIYGRQSSQVLEENYSKAHADN
jgi:hypothetical protein